MKPRKEKRRAKVTAPSAFFTPTEIKLIRLGLNHAAADGETKNAGSLLLTSLRKRNVRLEDILHLSPAYQRPAINYGEVLMSFGKFKGFRLKEIDPDYLRWVIENCELSAPRICRAIRQFLAAGYDGEGRATCNGNQR
jgi:uncharacterized protein (DUF3820 family)